jgi:hypothetical protein
MPSTKASLPSILHMMDAVLHQGSILAPTETSWTVKDVSNHHDPRRSIFASNADVYDPPCYPARALILDVPRSTAAQNGV